MTYLDTLARIALAFSHEWVISTLLIVGYIWVDRETCFHSTGLVLISMIVNVALKVTFQVPLNPSLGKAGFAFPSGHMQTAVVLYGFFYTVTPYRSLKYSFIALLIMIGSSLIYFGYHNVTDVMGAILFALILIHAYQYLLQRMKASHLFLGMIFFALSCLIYIKCVDIIPPHLWAACCALCGLRVAQSRFNSRTPPPLTLIKSMHFLRLPAALRAYFFSRLFFPCHLLSYNILRHSSGCVWLSLSLCLLLCQIM